MRLTTNITIMAYSEIDRVQGFVGNFVVDIKRKAAMVDWNRCVGCEVCVQKCPAQRPIVQSGSRHHQGHLHSVPAGGAQRRPSKPTTAAGSSRVSAECAPACVGRSFRLRAVGYLRSKGVWRHCSRFRHGCFPLGGVYPQYGGGKIPDVISVPSTNACSTPRALPGVRCAAISNHEEPKTVVFIQWSAPETSRSDGRTVERLLHVYG
jgi:heterodisulfide reductase subunit A